MSDFYFAYGSNMNPARMRARGLSVAGYWPARLPGYTLRFNKRAHNKTGIAYANIAYAPDDAVQGVLYQLAAGTEIALMDHYEGTPVRYSREKFCVCTDVGASWAWVYVANPAYIGTQLSVEQAYLEHLLSAGDLLAADYRERLRRLAPVVASETPTDVEQGLRFNV